MKKMMIFFSFLCFTNVFAESCLDLSGEYKFIDTAENCSMKKDTKAWFCDDVGCTGIIKNTTIKINQGNCEQVSLSFRDHFYNQNPESADRVLSYNIADLSASPEYKVFLDDKSFTYNYKKIKNFGLGFESAKANFEMALGQSGNLQIKWSSHYKAAGLGFLIIPMIYNKKNHGSCTFERV